MHARDNLEADAGLATMDLHRSNLLRIQIDELLEECQLDLDSKKWYSQAQAYMQNVSKIILGLHVEETSSQKQGDKPVSVKILPAGADAAGGGLSVDTFGCTKFNLFSTTKSGNAQVLPTFELMVKIPDDAFSGKDFMNYRYFDKKEIVMESVAKALSQHPHIAGDVDVVWACGSGRSPVLRLRPPSKPRSKGVKYQVYISFGMQSIEWIPKIRLVPNRVNIKASKARAQLYNHSLLHDARHLFEDNILSELAQHKNCSDALILIKVWALQRGLWRNHDGWSESSVAILIVYLLRTSAINSRMTPFQLFTVVLQTWVNTDWLGDKRNHEEDAPRAAVGQTNQVDMNVRRKRKLIVMPLDVKADIVEEAPYTPISETDPETLTEAYEWTDAYLLGPVFLDSSMTYNYLGNVSPNFMKVLCWHAGKSLRDLNRSRSSFEVLFMSSARFWTKWDVYFKLSAGNHSTDDWECMCRSLLQKLEAGLGNRIFSMRILTTGNGDLLKSSADSDQFFSLPVEKWMVSDQVLNNSPIGTRDIVIGVSINQEASQRAVDRGPPTERHKDVSNFLKLWGQKAQLRRFKDGAIVHAVVWENEKLAFKNEDKWGGGFVPNIVEYLVGQHLPDFDLSMSLPTMLSFIDTFSNNGTQPKSSTDPCAAYKEIFTAFEGLSAILRETSLMTPLKVDGVYGASPALRYSELYPPTPHPLLGYKKSSMNRVAGALVFEPVLVQIKFSPSSKWPTDLHAIGAAKAAMLRQLADNIEKSGEKGFDGVLSIRPTHLLLGYLGFCFKLVISADAEIGVLERLARPGAEAVALLRDLKINHEVSLRHHSMIHAVNTLHPSAGSVVRLARRWADCHLLSGHLSTELIELVVARLYSQNSAFVAPPSSVQAGFMRFLQLLESFDWQREPLIVDPRDHIQDEEYDEIYHTFRAIRNTSKYRGPAMYLIAPYNKDVGMSQQHESTAQLQRRWEPSILSPEAVVLKRILYLAKQSREFMHRCLKSFDDSNLSAIFLETPDSLKSFSLLMRVEKELIVDYETSSMATERKSSRSKQDAKETSFSKSMASLTFGPRVLTQKVYRNVQTEATNLVLPSWQPVGHLVERLRKRFGSMAIFFFNQNCPEIIGVLWRPQLFLSSPFSAMSSEYVAPLDTEWKSDSLVSKNRGDIIREMCEYSKDIVTTVRVFDDSSLSHVSKRQKVK